VEVDAFEGLLVDYARRGARARSSAACGPSRDFEYEFQLPT
jgi:phosphopantetheine adenylyltransferase